MAKKLSKKPIDVNEITPSQGTEMNARALLAHNSYMSMQELFRMRGTGGLASTGRRDIEKACGYETSLDFKNFFELWDKGDVATRVVEAYPEYTWSQNPEVYEDESEDVTTPFEVDWKAHVEKSQPFAELCKLDILAGIGKFGIMVIGVNDGKKLDTALVPENKTEKTKREISYYRAYTEGEVKIKTWDVGTTSPRYGLPVLYTVTPSNGGSSETMSVEGGAPTPKTKGKEETANVDPFVQSFDVHHSRVIHFADNALSSKVYGRERLRQVYNRITDILKIVGGSAEMFWQGAFSGISFEMDPDAEISASDKQKMKEDIDNYVNKLQRTLLLQGVKANPMSPSISSPVDHLDVQLTLISIATKIPKRILSGSEMGKLASSQDSANWEIQVQSRRNKTANPFLLVPYVNFCIVNGIVSAPKAGAFKTLWHPIAATSKEERARSAEYFTTALETFCGKALYLAMTFSDYLYYIHGYTSDEAKILSRNFKQDAFEKMREDMLKQKETTPASEDSKTASAKAKSKTKEKTATKE
jgi:hypothetical protein